jgi:hypothetical protein
MVLDQWHRTGKKLIQIIQLCDGTTMLYKVGSNSVPKYISATKPGD